MSRNMRKIGLKGGALVALTLGVALQGAETAHAEDPIRIPLHNWNSQLVGAEVLGRVLQKAGVQVEYVPADSGAVYEALCQGDVDLVHEVWEGSFGPAFEKQVKKGCVLDVSTYDVQTREEWWYPLYVEEVCPGLPDWQALNKCAEVFATAETAPKGRYLAGPAEWMKGDDQRVAGLGLNFQVVNAGSDSILRAELLSAVDRKQPIVVFNYTPNWIDAKIPGKFVEFPKYVEGCSSDPKVGPSAEYAHDCANAWPGYMKMAAWSGLPEKNPTAYEIVKRVNLTNAQVAQMYALVEVDGLDPQAAATKWMEDNESTWQHWLKGS